MSQEALLDRIWREVCELIPDPTFDSYTIGAVHAIVTDAIEDDPVAETSYEQYLRSDGWRRTRQLALEYYGDKCCLCNNPNNLNVHHRTYERKGHEKLADLIVLCRDCHASYHGR